MRLLASRIIKRSSARGMPPSPVVLLAVFAAGVDNFVAAPMLLAIGDGFGQGLAVAAGVVAAYAFIYGFFQLVWVYASDRWGRLAIIRVGLALASVATVASAFAPDIASLIVLRGIAGAGFAAVVPSTITYIGDKVPVEKRAGTLSDLVAAYAGGSAAGIVCGGVASDVTSWRVGFAASAAITILALLMQLRYARDPVEAPRALRAFTRSIRITVSATWPRVVALLALFEGAVLIGFLTFFPAAIEEGGASGRVAGLVVALYGVAIVLASRPARRLAAYLPRPVSLAGGILCAGAGLAVAASSTSIPTMAIATVLVSMGFALVHPLIQQWATIVIPSHRATAVGLFATALFVGTAVTTQAVAPLLDTIGFGWVFGAGAVLAGVLAVMLAVAWSHFERATAQDKLP